MGDDAGDGRWAIGDRRSWPTRPLLPFALHLCRQASETIRRFYGTRARLRRPPDHPGFPNDALSQTPPCPRRSGTSPLAACALTTASPGPCTACWIRPIRSCSSCLTCVLVAAFLGRAQAIVASSRASRCSTSASFRRKCPSPSAIRGLPRDLHHHARRRAVHHPPDGRVEGRRRMKQIAGARARALSFAREHTRSYSRTRRRSFGRQFRFYRRHSRRAGSVPVDERGSLRVFPSQQHHTELTMTERVSTGAIFPHSRKTIASRGSARPMAGGCCPRSPLRPAAASSSSMTTNSFPTHATQMPRKHRPPAAGSRRVAGGHRARAPAFRRGRAARRWKCSRSACAAAAVNDLARSTLPDHALRSRRFSRPRRSRAARGRTRNGHHDPGPGDTPAWHGSRTPSTSPGSRPARCRCAWSGDRSRKMIGATSRSYGDPCARTRSASSCAPDLPLVAMDRRF